MDTQQIFEYMRKKNHLTLILDYLLNHFSSCNQVINLMINKHYSALARPPPPTPRCTSWPSRARQQQERAANTGQQTGKTGSASGQGLLEFGQVHPLFAMLTNQLGEIPGLRQRQRVCKLEREGLPSVDQLPGDRQSCSSTGKRRSIAHFSGE